MRQTKLMRLAFAGVLATAFQAPAIAATVFSQDFQTAIDPISGLPVVRCSGPGGAGTYPFPPGWALRNVDNRTPDASTFYVNAAWTVREDFALDSTNCVAFSNSFYSPPGNADDWMWTPLIGPLPAGASALSWRARSFDANFRDGYEVRIMLLPSIPNGGTGVIGNQLTDSTLLFSTAAEETAWTPHVVSLDAYAGQLFYIGFRNNTNDRFLLVVDDVVVSNERIDLAAFVPDPSPNPYARVPTGVPVDIDLQVVARNLGTSELTNVAASAQLLRDATPVGPALESPSIASLPVGSQRTFTLPSQTLDADGAWTVEYSVTADQSADDDLPANDVVSIDIGRIGGNELARHEGDPIQTAGIGAGNGGEVGTSFTLAQEASFEGIRFVMNPVVDPTPPDPPNSWPGKIVVARLRATDVTGKPTDLIAETEAITSSYEGGVYDVRFIDGPQLLAPGTWFASVVEPVAPEAMPLIATRNRYTASTNWVIWPTIPGGTWRTLESFGNSFQVAPGISLLTDMFDSFEDGFESPMMPRVGASDVGSAATRTRAAHPELSRVAESNH